MSSEVIFFLVWFPNVANVETVKLSNSIPAPAIIKITQICPVPFLLFLNTNISTNDQLIAQRPVACIYHQ